MPDKKEVWRIGELPTQSVRQLRERGEGEEKLENYQHRVSGNGLLGLVWPLGHTQNV